MITNTHHLALIKLFKDNQNVCDNHDWVKHYLGTTKNYYGLKTSVKVTLFKNYLKSIKPDFKDFQELLLSLSRGNSFEELSSMGTLLGLYPEYRIKIKPKIVNQLFDHVEGWAETDVTCSFSAGDMLSDWTQWEQLLKQFVKSSNIHKRRAGLVLLVYPTRQSPDSRFSNLAFSFIDILKPEKDVLITKAISWILRSLIKYHPEEVADYLNKNKDSLPKIALREATHKLQTGRKNPKKLKT